MLGTIAAIGGIASAASSFLGGRSAKKASKKAARQQEALGREQASLIGMETEEELRRYDLNREKTLASGEALAAASGFGAGGSQDVYMESLETEFALERDWISEVSEQRQDVARMTGQYSADALRSQGKQSMYQGIGGMFQGIATGVGYL